MAHTPNDWAALEALIDRVLDAAPEARSALIADLTGPDAARRAELERLVAECEQTYPLLDRPVAERFGALFEGETMRVPALLADRYRIVRELGHGGMAVVYLAHDIRHERDVAVKIIRPELAATLGRARFLREISIAAKLKHPHIMPLFDSGEVDDLLYYVMPYQEEQSLRARLKRDGALPVNETVAILRDVCDALSYAHEQGVVHRDIKPDNILLSGRHALVTDFGVARAVTAAAEQETLTTAGSVVGTAAYMAPEQASASSEIDHRVDIYAVGVMAYEMLAGERPFSGDTPSSQRPAHAEKAALDLTRLRNDLSPFLAAVVTKCLATQPVERYQSAAEVLAKLAPVDTEGLRPRPSARWRSVMKAAGVAAIVGLAALLWAVRPTTRSAKPGVVPKLAVLVFQHGSNEELEPLAVGLTENLIGALGGAGLAVPSLNAVLPYRDGLTPIDSVGERLGVNWLLGGQLYRRGDQTVATVALTDAASGRLIARSEASAARGDDVRLIEQLVPTVATLVRERVGEELRIEGWRAGTRSRDAFAALHRADREVRDARFLVEAGDVPGALTRLHSADSALARSAQADPRWVEPIIQRAWVARHRAGVLSAVSPESVSYQLRRGGALAEAALRLAPREARALEVLGIVLHGRSVLAAPPESVAALRANAERVLREATEADTSLVRALSTLSLIHVERSEYEQASLLAARAYSLDAHSEDALQLLARLFTVNFEDNEDVEARRWCDEYRRVFPQDWYGGYCRLLLMMWDSTEVAHVDTAWNILRRATAMAPEEIRPAVGAQLEMLVAGVLARTGPRGAAERVLSNIRARSATDARITREPLGTELLLFEASVRARLRRHNEAIALLREYVRRRPGSAATFARSRRFRDLPHELLIDATIRGR